MTVADLVASWLHEKGVTHTFGIVGGGNHTLFDAIARLGKTEIVAVHAEQAAVMAAAYFYRVSGRIAVALVTTGAGSTNAITGVVAAWMDSIPVIVLSGNEASRYMYQPTRVWGVQGYCSKELVDPVCKATMRMRAPHDVSMKWLDACLETALKPRQGPVWVDLCKDIAGAVVE